MLVECKESCLKTPKLRNGGSTIASFYDIVETDIDGNTVDFSSFRGSIVYIVNVASQCGYTAQNYETFRSLAKYKDEGLQIVIAPCNQVE